MKKRLLPFLLFLAATPAAAQFPNVTLPEASQAASLSQRVALTEIAVTYHSPLVRGRKIWGDLVPYGEVWRAGANQNTTIAFSTDVTIEGHKMPAGKYGLHMIPTTDTWTIILSKNADAWGSFFYKQEEDALRFTVRPEEVQPQEWLSYTFEELKPASAVLALRWEKLRIPMKIEVDVPQTVVANMRKELTNLQGFNPDAYYTAAAYCFRNNVNQEEAMTWLDRSITDKPTFANQKLKAEQLEKQGKKAEADALTKKALAMADEAGMNAYGYQLIGQGKTTEALEIFKANVKKYPASWNVYDSLGEAYETAGDKKNALANYKTARAKCPPAQQARLDATIAKLSK